MPAIHPFIGINSLPAVNHQPEFTAHCIKEPADQALHDAALAMAWTAIDMAQDDALSQSSYGQTVGSKNRLRFRRSSQGRTSIFQGLREDKNPKEVVREQPAGENTEGKARLKRSR